MLDVLTLAREDTRLHKASIREYAGPCPNPDCGRKTDGFRVRCNDDERWVFMCRGCWDSQEYLPDKDRNRGWGDAIDYLRHFRGMSFQQAKAMVAGQEEEAAAPAAPERAFFNYHSDEWQAAAHKAMQEHTARLWSPDDTTALDYARSRGLKDETIRQFQLGYSIQKGVPRLIIPSINEKRYVAIYRRDLRPDIPKELRWRDAPGGTKNELYLADCLWVRKDLPVVLVEDALSALSLWQECSDLVNVVATGSANCGQFIKWLVRLALAPAVLIALDADESGDREADWWLERLKNAQRLRPLLKDPNDMLQANYSLRDWIAYAIPVLAAAPESCSVCGQHMDTGDFYYDPDGKLYCALHWSGATSVQEVAQDHHPEPEEPVSEKLANRDQARTPDDYWRKIKAGVERPPVDANGRPFYTREQWLVRLEELRNQVPDPKLTKHIKGA